MNKTIYTSTKKDQGRFQFYAALVTDENGLIKTFKDPKTGQVFLKGKATDTTVDKEYEHPGVAFIETNKDLVLGKNVFCDHDHKIVDTVGFVSDVGGDEGEMFITTSLEDPKKNSKVQVILDKIDHGTKISYSIGGRVTKASEYYNEDEKRNVVQFDKGFIDEFTLTPFPAANETDVARVQKSLRKSLDSMDKVDPEEKECDFWENYEKAQSKTENEQPSWEKVDKAKLPQECFADQGEIDQRSTWGYPYKYVNKDGVSEIHAEGLDFAWAFANGVETNEKASVEIIDVLKVARKSLNLESKNLYFLDLEKTIASTLAEVVENKDVQARLSTIIWAFNDKMYDLIYDLDVTVEVKFKAIYSLIEELTSLLIVEFGSITEKTMSEIIALSLTVDEVLVMKTEKTNKTDIKEVEGLLDEETQAKIKVAVGEIITKTFSSIKEKNEKVKEDEKADGEKAEKNADNNKPDLSDSKVETMLKELKDGITEIISQSVENKDGKKSEKAEKSSGSETDEDNPAEVSEEMISLQIIKFFEDNPDVKLVGRKQSVMKALEREQGVDINEIVNDEAKFKSLDAETQNTLLGAFFSGSLK